MDMDEHLRETHEKNHAELIATVKKMGLVLDLASSDVVMHLKDDMGGSVCIG